MKVSLLEEVDHKDIGFKKKCGRHCICTMDNSGSILFEYDQRSFDNLYIIIFLESFKI